MTAIGWVRHGVTDWNLERRAQGQTDVPLNEIGREQAHALAERLKAEPAWDVIYSSDLSRALETAETIGRALGLPVVTDVRLREMSFGTMEGTTPEERLLMYGSDWETLEFGREKPEEGAARGTAFAEEIVRKHPGQRVLAVSHGALIANTLKALSPNEDWASHLRNTSITIMRLEEAGWRCELYNCTKHIDVGA